jgi:hypothetical protein
LRGIQTQLYGGLKGGLPEVGEQVADFLLGGVDDLAGGGSVDGLGHALTQLLEAATQEFEEILGR